MRDSCFDIGSRFAGLKAVLPFFVSLLAIYVIFSRFDVSEVFRVLKGADVVVYVVGFFIYYLSFIVRGHRWKVLLGNVGLKVDLRGSSEILYVSWFVDCLVPAKVGDVYRAYLVKRNYNCSGSKVLGTVFAERILDISFILFFLGVVFLFYFGNVLELAFVNYVFFGVLVLFFVILFYLVLVRYGSFFVNIMFPRFKKRLSLFFEGLRALSLGRLAGLVGDTVVIWFCQFALLFFVSRALGLEVDLLLIVFVSVIDSLLTIIPLTPSGVGISELVTSEIFASFGVERSFALSMVVLNRVAVYWSILFFGGVMFIVRRKRMG